MEFHTHLYEEQECLMIDYKYEVKQPINQDRKLIYAEEFSTGVMINCNDSDNRNTTHRGSDNKKISSITFFNDNLLLL